MKRILSLANKLKLDRQEKPKRASVKKKNPRRFWKPAMSLLKHSQPRCMHKNDSATHERLWKKNPPITKFPNQQTSQARS